MQFSFLRRSPGLVLFRPINFASSFFHAMLERGVYLAPSAFEAGFMSSAHSEQDIADTLQAARAAFSHVRKSHATVVMV